MTVAPLPSDESPARHVVGIDLGTTNSAVAAIDTTRPEHVVETFRIPQLTAPGQVEALDTLPSFHFEPAPEEVPPGGLKLPWNTGNRTWCVGTWARDQGLRHPQRQVAAAKSWLCHHGVDRTAALLPWQSTVDSAKLSPLEASARYLQQIREAWDHAHPNEPLAKQDVAITLPASFDEVARELTVKAAAKAGLPRVLLLEEPQAAFYDWLQTHRGDWQSRVKAGQKILVCDVGGGTTDLTLIRVRRTAQGGLMLHRVAVGEHLILGGDNLDLALAHHLEAKLTQGQGQGKLPAASWATLVRTCRAVKETLLGENPPAELPVVVAGGGARLIAQAKQTTLTRSEAETLLLEGFLPACELAERPAAARGGFREFGLPYAADPAITRHLAAFLTTHRHAGDLPDDPPRDGDPARPDIVLFNGGFFESALLRNRLLDVLAGWFRDANGTPQRPEVFVNPRLDLAVAHGAAYFGLVRRGQGIRISAPLARTYYVEIGTAGEAAPQALCLLPAGLEEGSRVVLEDRPLELRVRRPVEFPLHASSVRLTDRPGELVAVDREQLVPLPPIRTVLETRKSDDPDRVTIRLEAGLTEIGTLELGCREVDGPRRWKLQFDVRSTVRTDLAAHDGRGERAGIVDETLSEAARQAIRAVFAPDGTAPPEELVKTLETVLGSSRLRWPPTLLRELWAELLDHESARRRSAMHEARWLNLLGYALRPGYGLAVDDWRVAATWKLLQGTKLIHGGPACRIESLILWRRIAGGLAAGQQQALAEPLVGLVRPLFKTLDKPPSKNQSQNQPQKPDKKGKPGLFGTGGHEAAETWRLLGGLELLPNAWKHDLGRLALRSLPREESTAVRGAMWWAIGRFGARVPLFGPLNGVLPAGQVEAWVDQLLTLDSDDEAARLALLLCARKTDDRWRDIPDRLRGQAAAWLRRKQAPPRWAELLEQAGELEHAESEQVFGESLPHGLSLAT